MVTKSTNSQVKKDMVFGQPMMIVSTPDADIKGDVDYTIGTLHIAYRTRRCRKDKWGEISIRNSRVSGAKTEKQKILDGECESRLFVFEFTDAWVLCIYPDILSCVKRDIGYIKPNNDGTTSAYYIAIKDIPHATIKKKIVRHENAASKK